MKIQNHNYQIAPPLLNCPGHRLILHHLRPIPWNYHHLLQYVVVDE